jgi:hypothetical protein
MYNKRETKTFYTAELMLEQDKSFDEAAKVAGLSEEQKETLRRGATTARMPIKDYMKHVSFYDKPSSFMGNLLRWWFEKTFVEQFLFIAFIVAVVLLVFGRSIVPLGNWQSYMIGH